MASSTQERELASFILHAPHARSSGFVDVDERAPSSAVREPTRHAAEYFVRRGPGEQCEANR